MLDPPEIHGTVFLAGDMHSSYHATMELADERKSVVVHELMSSPVNHMEKSRSHEYHMIAQRRATHYDFNYETHIEPNEFYSAHSNAMLVSVGARAIATEAFPTQKAPRGEGTGHSRA